MVFLAMSACIIRAPERGHQETDIQPPNPKAVGHMKDTACRIDTVSVAVRREVELVGVAAKCAEARAHGRPNRRLVYIAVMQGLSVDEPAQLERTCLRRRSMM